MPPEEEMTPLDRQAYEQACVEETRAQCERLSQSEHVPHKIREVRLEGGYPDTKVHVRWWDTRYELEDSRSYAIWRHHISGKPVFEGAEGRRESPYTVGMLIATWVSETSIHPDRAAEMRASRSEGE
jgi:hypothetical protein